MREFRRAYKMLRNGATFEQVCVSPPEVPMVYHPRGYVPYNPRGRTSSRPRGGGGRRGSSSRRISRGEESVEVVSGFVQSPVSGVGMIGSGVCSPEAEVCNGST